MKIRPEDWEETIAQLIHERSHRAGTGQVCDKCRAQASGVAVGPGPALRRRLGRLEQPAAKMYRALFFSIRDFVKCAVVAAPDARRILEIGCGEGDVASALTRAYPSAEYVGIDISQEPGRRFEADRTRVSFSTKSSAEFRASCTDAFDLVVAADVLHHIREDSDRAALLADAVSLVADGGVVLLKEWERNSTVAYRAGWAAELLHIRRPWSPILEPGGNIRAN